MRARIILKHALRSGGGPVAALALALLAALPARAAEMGAGAVLDVPGYEAISAPEEARGAAGDLVLKLAAIVAKRPDSEAASLALLRLQDQRGDAPDTRAVLVQALEEALAAPMRDPRARDRTCQLLALLEAELGDWDGARAAMAARGPIRSWLMVGPFGFTRRALHDRPFPPEIVQRAARIDPGETYEGSAGRVGWRKVEVGPLVEGFSPSDHIQPEQGCAYALAQLRATPGTKAVLVIACRGSFKGWWGGELVADVDRASGYHPGRVTVAVTFGEGWHRLLLKDTQGSAQIGAWLTSADGSGPVRGLEVEATGQVAPPGTPGEARRLALPTAPDGAGPWAKAAAALELADLGLAPLALPLIEAASQAAPGSAHLAWLHARLLESADHLPQTRRANDARAAVGRALTADAKFLPALERRARWHDEDGKPEEALRTLLALGKDHPRYVPAHRSAAVLARRLGWTAELLGAIAALETPGRPSALPKALLAEHYWRLDNRARALELYEEALKLDASAAFIEDRVATASLERGDVAAAERLRKEAVARYPGEPGPLRALAEVYRRTERPELAADLLLKAADLRGGDPDDLERLAEMLIEAGRERAAVPHLRRALAAEPGRYHLRRLLARIEGEDADFARPYRVQVRPIAEKAPGAEKYPKAHTICLLDQTVSRVYRDGSKTDYVHQAFKILDAQGVERYHTIRLPGEILELRTIGADGRLYEPVLTDNTDQILMPKLEPGAVIEYAYRSTDARRPAFQFDSGSFYFKDPNFIEPFLRSVFVVIVDKGFDFETIARNMPVEDAAAEEGDTVVHVWDVRDSDRVDVEPFMPDKDEILPHVQLVERRTWDDIAEVYAERLVGHTRLTPELRGKAAEVTGDGEGDAEKARRLYDFVLDHVRAEGRGNDDAAEILVERKGSRLILLRALLDAAEVPSRFAVCGANPALAPLEVWDPPRPELLHAPALVIEPRDADPVWVLDGGRLFPYGFVPSAVQGAPALLLGGGGGEMRVVPTEPVESEATRTSLSIALSGRKARVEGETEVRDAGAYRFKEQIVTAQRAQLRNLLEAQLAQVFRGARLVDFDFPAADEPGVPLRITYTADVPSFVNVQGERRLIRPGLDSVDLTQSFGGRPQRQHPMMLRLRRAQRDVVDIDIGEDFEVESVPSNLLLRDRFGHYSLTYAIDGRRIQVVRSLAIEPARIEPGEYGSVLRFCREVDAAEKKWIELRERTVR